MPYSTRLLEDNSEVNLDGDSDVDYNEYETEGKEKIVERMGIELD
jgi:hypothetical protein